MEYRRKRGTRFVVRVVRVGIPAWLKRHTCDLLICHNIALSSEFSFDISPGCYFIAVF